MKEKLVVCPVCKGRVAGCVACKGIGKIPAPLLVTKNWIKDPSGKNKRAAEKLRAKGYTLREIGKILGYNHPQKIANLLNKKS